MADIAKLQALIAESEVAHTFFTYLSKRERNRTETSAAQAVRMTGMDNTSVLNLFRQLEDLELGTFKLGRRGMASRFEWSVRMIDAAKAALGKADSIEVLDDAEIDDTTEDDDEASVEHLFYLRLDSPPVAISLPPDLTAKEADRLSQFIRALPIED